MKISISLVAQVLALVLLGAAVLGHPLAFAAKVTPPVAAAVDWWATFGAFVVLWLGGPLVDGLVKPKS